MSTQRSISSVHAEWLSLLEVSGPFLSANVLSAPNGFPQGLPELDGDGDLRNELRGFYHEWRTDIAKRKPSVTLHRLWIKAVMDAVLEWDEVLAERTDLPESLKYQHLETGETIRPDFALIDPDTENPAFLISTYPHSQRLQSPVADSRWAEPPSKRMEELLRATDIRLGLVTNGEQWMLVNAPAEEATGFATWYANLWFEEKITLTAFRAILGIERLYGVDEDSTLTALLTASADDQASVTYTLGDQVRQSIELLVAAIDREDATRNGALLEHVEDETVYEAAVTVMMRLVFLLFAEDQQPPLFGGDAVYDSNYSISAMIAELENQEQQSSIEYLDHKRDAWQRLLATFRLVYAGSPHDRMRQPAYGGSLFDPDRFPFLEGRQPGSNWQTDEASPLPVTNRTVLHVLQALQYIQLKSGQGRQKISFRALDVEQIGHVYEQLLEHTARRSKTDVLGLTGTTKKGVSQEPELEITQLEEWQRLGDQELVNRLNKATGRSKPTLTRSLAAEVETEWLSALRHVCGDEDTLQRILPFANLIRPDRAGRPLVIRPGGLYVTSGSDRATTGSHYTPRSLTEPIVQYALEPLIYDGPAEGKPREEWVLHSPKHLLELNICDPAMGSGGFLVQTTRYMADRLLEAWDIAEDRLLKQDANAVRTIAPDGTLHSGNETEHLLPRDKAERLAIARQMVVDHCLYGVDINHLAVDMAKLSLWLITLQRNRPFTFLDHRLRCGDSLLGIHTQDQLLNFSLDGKSKDVGGAIFAQLFRNVMTDIRAARDKIEAIEVRDVTDSRRQAKLLDRAERETELLRLGADLLVAAQLHPEKKQREPQRNKFRNYFTILVNGYDRSSRRALTQIGKKSTLETRRLIADEANRLLKDSRPFHWALEFPEVFQEESGFHAIVGNPPFLGGKQLRTLMGDERYGRLRAFHELDQGAADLASYFFFRALTLLSSRGRLGMLAPHTIVSEDSRKLAFETYTQVPPVIFRVVRDMPWPGVANTRVSLVHVQKGTTKSEKYIDGDIVPAINSLLLGSTGAPLAGPKILRTNRGRISDGTKVHGDGFILDREETESLVSQDPRNLEVIRPYLNGVDLNRSPDRSASRYVIDFGTKDYDEASAYQAPFQIVTARVKPYRDGITGQKHEQKYWLHWDKRAALYRTIKNYDEVIVMSATSKHVIPALVPNVSLYDQKLKVFTLKGEESLGLLQSCVHEIWAHRFSPPRGEGIAYSGRGAFLTFPLPSSDSLRNLRIVGANFENLRRQLQKDLRIGLTNLHNMLNDRENSEDQMDLLRESKRQLDQSAVNMYGWHDITLNHGFRPTAQGVRFTISEAAQEEILQRLVRLNHDLYEEEHERAQAGKDSNFMHAQQSEMF